MAGDPLLAPDVAKTLGCCRFKIDLPFFNPTIGGNPHAHGGEVITQSRRLRDNRDVDVIDLPSALRDLVNDRS